MMRETKTGFFAGFGTAVLVGALAVAVIGVEPSRALEQVANEREALKECEKRLCDIVVNKAPAGDDLSCRLSKTWQQSNIKEGVEKKKLAWTFGDARCSVELSAKRDLILDAVTKTEHALELPPHTVRCEIERGTDVTTINIQMAPKISFKNGSAEKAWLNVKSIEGPAVVRGAIWTAAQIEDNFGLFHGDLIAEINKFLQKSCPKALAAH
jgi:hypothetical protein